MNTLVKVKTEEGLSIDIFDLGKGLEVGHIVAHKCGNTIVKEINYFNEPLFILDGDKIKIVFREVILG